MSATVTSKRTVWVVGRKFAHAWAYAAPVNGPTVSGSVPYINDARYWPKPGPARSCALARNKKAAAELKRQALLRGYMKPGGLASWKPEGSWVAIQVEREISSTHLAVDPEIDLEDL